METQAYDKTRLASLADQIVACTRELAARGWTPATGGNFSMRLDDRHVAVTKSGRDKGRLVPEDIMVVDLAGKAIHEGQKPSAETVLHTQLYARDPDIGCVLHTHSLVQTVASRLYAGAGKVRFEDYELIKAFRGEETHDTAYEMAVLANNQCIPTLAAQVDVLLDKGMMWGYLIEGHGMYAWGKDMAEARRHLEAFDFLLSCELEMRKLRP